MVTKILKYFLSFVAILIITLFSHPSHSLATTTITVCPAPGEGCDYGIDDPQNNGDVIQQAIDAAPVGNPADKTIIHLKNGAYVRQNFTEVILDNGIKRKYFIDTKGKNLILGGETNSLLDGANSANMSGIISKSGEIVVRNLMISGFKRDEDSCFQNDKITACSRGRGIMQYGDSQATITNNTISGSEAEGIYIGKTSKATISNNVMRDLGTGIAVRTESEATITNNTISGSEAEGIYIGETSKATITNNSIIGNRAFGISMYSGYDHNPSVTVVNNILAFTKKGIDNLYGYGIGGVGIRNPDRLSNDIIRFNLIYGNEGDNTNCAGYELCEFEGRLYADPKFVDLANGDFHLQSDSPARNAGIGDDPDGTNADIGAYGGPGACGFDPQLPGCTSTTTPIPPNTNTPTSPHIPAEPGWVNEIEFADPATKLYYPLIMRNWPSQNPGHTQWSHFVLSNPNDQTANVKINVYSAYAETIPMGNSLKSYSIAIPAHGWYSSFNDENWIGLPDNYNPDGIQTLGSLEIQSDVPITGFMRWQLRQGNTKNSPVTQPHDTPLVTDPSKTLNYPLVIQNWNSSGTTTQWSDIILFNPHTTATATVLIKLYDATTGNRAATIERMILPKSIYLSSIDQDWADLSKNGTRLLATMTITSTEDIVAMNRWRRVDGEGNINASAQQIVDTRFTQTSSNLYYPLFLKNWGYTSSGYTQWSDVVLYNPNDRSVSVKITAHNNAGGTSQSIEPFTITIPARRFYNSYRNADWDILPDSNSAEGKQTNVSLTIETPEDSPITGIVRLRINKGSDDNDVSYLIQDNPLIVRKPTLNTVTQSIPLVIRGTNSGMASTRVWSDLILYNTTDSAKKVTFKVYSSDTSNVFRNGDLIRIFEETIPAYGWLNTHGHGQWQALPTTIDNPLATRASAEIIHEPGVVGIQRMRYMTEPPSNVCQKKTIGDADCSNDVTDNDYDIWRREFIRSIKTTISDFNNDGKVKAIDYEIWRKQKFSSGN